MAKRRGKIVYSVLVVLLLVGMIPLLISAWRLIKINRDILETDQKIIQQNIASSIAEEVSLYLEGMKASLRNIARSLEVTLASRGGQWFSKRELSQLLRYYIAQYPNLRKLVVVDLRGKGSEVGYSFSDPEIEQALRQGYMVAREGEEFLSSTHLIFNLKETVVLYSLPIKDRGKVVGVISAIISLTPIQRVIDQRSKFGHTIYAVDADGKLFAHSNLAEVLKRQGMRKRVIVADFFRAGGRASITRSFVVREGGGKVRYLGTSIPIPGLEWGVFVEMPEKVAYYSVYSMIKQTSSWVIATIIAVVIVSILFARRITGPIDELARGARIFGKGDFSQKIKVAVKNELGELAETMNSMAEALARHIRQIKQALIKNEELFMGTIKMISAAVDEKDPYTRGHSERVSTLSVAIGRELGLSEEEIRKVEIAAILHDVGKIGIDDALLKKPEGLTPEEYERLKQHPLKGANILSPVRELAEMIPGMLYHHENLDGTGYPMGLKGEEIPLIARIIAVADAFDAMTSERPYQRAMEPEAAIKRLFDLSETKFDPKVVAALLSAYEKGIIRVQRRDDSSLKIDIDEKNEGDLRGEFYEERK